MWQFAWGYRCLLWVLGRGECSNPPIRMLNQKEQALYAVAVAAAAVAAAAAVVVVGVVVVVVHTLSLTGYQKNYRIVSGIHQGK